MSAMETTAWVRERWPVNIVIARAGVGLGLFAFVVALPPFKVNALWVPVLIGLVAVAAGIWVVSRGLRRPGWTAIGFGIVGIGPRLRERDVAGRALRTQHLEPLDDRALGDFIAAAQQAGRDFTVDWVHLKLNDQAQRTVMCKDPFRAVDERVERLIASL